MRSMRADSVDAIVTDPPYGLGFMGKEFDKLGEGAAQQAWHHTWAVEALRVLKPGGHLLAFGGSRTFHRLVCAIEDAGFEIRDTIMWVYGSGFPKSLDVSKAIDKAAGAEREVVGYDASRARPNRLYEGGAIGNIGGTGNLSDRTDNGATLTAPATDAAKRWEGWGTALKPAHEPIVVARKPLIGTVAANVLRYGTGALNIDGGRVGFASELDATKAFPGGRLTSHGSVSLAGPGAAQNAQRSGFVAQQNERGRWPANVILDEEAGAMLDTQTGTLTSGSGMMKQSSAKTENGNRSAAYSAESRPKGTLMISYGDTGGASRFFYCAKASRAERGEGNTHPTVKPIALMRYLCRLVTPPGGLVLDSFAGSGTTGVAALAEGFRFLGIEREAEYVEIARRRLALED